MTTRPRSWILASAALGLLVVGALTSLVAAVESGEVVELLTRDGSGGLHATRVWLVEADGAWWLRGSSDAGWIERARRRPDVRLLRAGHARDVRAVAVDDAQARARVNRAMRDKYGWADAYLAWWLGDPDRGDAQPLRLESVRPESPERAARAAEPRS